MKIRFKFTKINSMSDLDIESKADDMALSKKTPGALEPGTMQEVVDLLHRFMKRDIPVMLVGSSGYAKSQLIRKAATNIPNFPVDKDNVLDIRAGMLNVEDLRGIPTLSDDKNDPTLKHTKSTVPTWLRRVIENPDKNFVLFFDELNHASAAVLNSVYGIMLERTLDDFKFEERTRIVAAGNKADQNEDLTELSDPLMRRMESIDIDKATGNDQAFYIEYLRDKYKDLLPAELLNGVLDTEEETGDPRSVERLLKAWTEDIKDGERLLTKSAVIPIGLYTKLQKIYSRMNIASKGSTQHKDLVTQVAEYIKANATPDKMISAAKVITAQDIIDGNLEGQTFTGEGNFGKKLSEEFLNEVRNKFISDDTSPEIIEAAISKVMKA